MKISKLFHWLYAILMLLPAFAIGVTCLYAIFNKNAFQSYYGETINEERIINTNDIEANRLYTFNYLSTQQQNRIAQTRISVSTFDLVYTNLSSWETSLNNIADRVNTIYFWVNTAANNQQNIQFYYTGEDNSQMSTTISLYNDNGSFGYVTFNFTPVNDITILNESASANISYIEYNSFSFVSEVFYYAIDKVQQSPLFSWANDSFLATPITYITRLFGMPDNNIAILLMSYWLDISIIYLVFDLIMYVPLLVHRWLDKGVLE